MIKEFWILDKKNFSDMKNYVYLILEFKKVI